MLTVDSNMVVPDELDQVRMRVETAGIETRLDKLYELGPGRTRLPFSLGLVPGADKAASFRVEAIGMRGGTPTVARSAVTSFVPGATLALHLDLLRECRGVTCDAGKTCVAGGTCGAESIDPHALPPYGHDGGVSPLDGSGVDRAPDSPGSSPDVPVEAGVDAASTDRPVADAATDSSGPDVPGPLAVQGQIVGGGGRSTGSTYAVVGAVTWITGSSAGSMYRVSAR